MTAMALAHCSWAFWLTVWAASARSSWGWRCMASARCFRIRSHFALFVGLLALSGLGISIFKIGGLALVGDVSTHGGKSHKTDEHSRRLLCRGLDRRTRGLALLLSRGLSWKWLYVIAAAFCVLLIAVACAHPGPGIALGGPQAASLRTTLRTHEGSRTPWGSHS